MEIRPYRQEDAAALAQLMGALAEKRPSSPHRLHQQFIELRDAGGFAWVLVDGEPVAYGTAVPVPGLPGVMELDGGVAAKRQRQGLGSRLLAHGQAQLARLGARQLTHAVTIMNEPAARFLLHHGFTVDHEEWLLCLSDLPAEPPSPPAPKMAIRPPANASRRRVARLFRDLYDASFGRFPWYQPYTDAEILQELDDPADMLFLFAGDTVIGFAWLHFPGRALGQIEPIGIIAAEQGQGYGRYLLNAALYELASRGATQAQIGVWRSNYAAIHLYQSVGFRRRETRIYLACELG